MAWLLTRAVKEKGERRSRVLNDLNRVVIPRFERILYALRDGSGEYGLEPLNDAQLLALINPVIDKWNTEIAPLLATSSEKLKRGETVSAESFNTLVPGYVDEINAFVGQLVRRYDEHVRFYAAIRLGTMALLMVLIVMVVLFTKGLVSSLVMLKGATEEVENGNFDVRVESRRADEVGSLVRSFNHMARALGMILDEKTRLLKKLNLLASFPEKSPDAVVEYDRKFRMTYQNPAAEKTWKRLGQDEPGFAPVDLEAVTGKLKREGSESTYTEVEVDDTVLGIHVHLLPDEERLRIYAYDITGYRRAEEAWRKSEENWAKTFDSITDFVSVHDRDFRLVKINRALADSLRIEREELVGRRCYEVFHNARRPVADCPVKRVFETGKAATVEMEDPKFGRLMITASPIFDESGKLAAVVQYAKDITELKRAEMEIRRSYDTQTVINALLHLSIEERDLDEILQRALDLILSIPWLSFESKGAVFLVEDEPEVLVLCVRKGLAEGLLESCARVSFGRCLCGRAGLRREIQFADSLDERHEFRYSGITPHGHYCVPILYGGTTLGVINIYLREGHPSARREIEFLTAVANTLAGIIRRKRVEEEKKRIQAQFLQAQKMEAVGTLAGGVAHDFNNLLTAILGYADMALSGLPEDHPVREEWEVVRSSGLAAANLTRQLLAFSRRQPMAAVPLDINQTLNGLLKLLAPFIGEDIELIADLAPNVRRIKGDVGNIEQVIMNLAVNARDSMPGGGKLTIGTGNVTLDEEACRGILEATPGEYVCLTVADTGSGMDGETLRHIFEPFFTTKAEGSGTGLGLSVVYGIVRQHAGWIHVESHPGNGTVFRVYFPVYSGKPEEEARKRMDPEELRGGGERILLVEDREDVRGFAVRALRGNGYDVTEAAGAEEALRVFEVEKGDFHLVFCDVVLPDRSGLWLVDRLLTSKPGLKVLLSSGYTDVKSQWPVIQKKGFPFLQKPYMLRDLLRTVKRVVLA